jgi:hypothetical protein
MIALAAAHLAATALTPFFSRLIGAHTASASRSN